MHKRLSVLLVAVLLVAYLAFIALSTTPGANFGCMPAPLPFGLNESPAGNALDLYCGS